MFGAIIVGTTGVTIGVITIGITIITMVAGESHPCRPECGLVAEGRVVHAGQDQMTRTPAPRMRLCFNLSKA